MMSLFGPLNISASALTATRLRMDVISSNIANANTTRAQMVDGKWTPYRRKMVEVAPLNQNAFDNYLQEAMSKPAAGEGVKVTKITEDQAPFKRVFDPANPDAGPDGYVQLPNVDLLKEMVDLMTVNRTYEANVDAFNAGKNMIAKAMEIGR